MRYVRFLVALLGIKSEISSSILESVNVPDFGNKIWTAPGFTVGKIVFCTPIADGSHLVPSDYAARLSASILQENELHNILEMLKELGEVPLGRLRLSTHTMTSINIRTLPASSTETAGPSDIESQSTYLVVIFTSCCEEARFLPGIAVGKAKKGDDVIYFLGHELAFITGAPATKLDNRRLTGRLLCAGSGSEEEKSDMITKQAFRFHTLQSVAELRTPVDQLELRITQSEMLSLNS
ncbi:MAG: hypothetical protein M1820_008542 [Bogoriella megaspora]|nr:MAG: hypothetical protein M1820_008542 [Bogoriella megaspora]